MSGRRTDRRSRGEQTTATTIATGTSTSDSTADPESVPSVTVNKVCGSGLEAVLGVARAIAVGEIDVGVAGGMESMSNAPHVIRGVRKGVRMGGLDTVDSMITDGLWNPYSNQILVACCQEFWSGSRNRGDLPDWSKTR